MCRARLSYTLVKGLPRHALWPVAVAALVRVTAWALISGARFASDEQGYVDAGIALAATGQQDLFWPPLTGWIVAAFKTIAPSAPLSATRLLWIAMDLGNVALVAVLAERIGRAARFAPYAYALYLPAISHAQFVTSEMPALLLVLSALVVVTSRRSTTAADLAAGVILGALILVRANLLPLLVMLPAAAFWQVSRPTWVRRTAVVGLVGAVIVGAAIARNWMSYGEPTLSRNAAYNLYIGNQDVYAEDLDLFHPRATPEQIEFRRQFFAGTLQYPTGTAAELQQRGARLDCATPGSIPETRHRTAGTPVRAEDGRTRVGRRRGRCRRVFTDRARAARDRRTAVGVDALCRATGPERARRSRSVARRAFPRHYCRLRDPLPDRHLETALFVRLRSAARPDRHARGL